MENLVRVHSVQPRHLSNTHAGCQRRCDVFNRAPPTAPLSMPASNFRFHSDALLHIDVVYLPAHNVQTAGTKRLQCLAIVNFSASKVSICSWNTMKENVETDPPKVWAKHNQLFSASVHIINLSFYHRSRPPKPAPRFL